MLRSSLEAVLEWKCSLDDMNKLSEAENRAKKVTRGQECTPKALLPTSAQTRVDQYFTRGGSCAFPEARQKLFLGGNAIYNM